MTQPPPGTRAFLALGSNDVEAKARLEAALSGLVSAGERLVAVAGAVESPYEDEHGTPIEGVPPVWNTVAEILTHRAPADLLGLLQRLEAEAGRDRAEATHRALDLDLLTHGDAKVAHGSPILPHPRANRRAFVLGPWEEIAPLLPLPGSGGVVAAHAAALRARQPALFGRLVGRGALRWPSADRATPCRVLETAEALRQWRGGCAGPVGLVPTMGALHRGHEVLLRRARATCDHVVATLFVNPLQFGPGEDLDRYPRTFDADRALLESVGADAVYVPAPPDLYPADFATFLAPEGPALGYEAAARPTHFRGVATVVYKLWRRTRPHAAFFGRKDAQQLAVLRRMVRDLELDGDIVACPTVRDRDGLALSSRNRYLSPDERARALALPRTLTMMAADAALGEPSPAVAARAALEEAGLDVDYLDIVDPDTFAPAASLAPATSYGVPVLAVAAVRVGRTRLLDNRWIARVPEAPR